MSYEIARNHEIHDAHQRVIDIFAKSYRCGQPTIVLLPGGMGSHLDRSTSPFVNDQSIPFPMYDPVWMDLEMIFGRDLELLRIEANGHDAGNHMIIPTGPLQFLVNAYDGTQRFFEGLGWNYIVFGYDWRRSLEEAASQLTEFLADLRDRVKDLRDCDPLPTTTLLAHSQGGLVGKIFLQSVSGDDGGGIGLWMERFVTVGTPFYGTSSHQDRYYQGQSPLNIFYGKRRVAEIAGSLPGPYLLMFADQTALDAGTQAKLGLSGYPITDSATGAPADPYDPANFGRYPSWVNTTSLEDAVLARETIVADLPKAVADRVFHIRSGLNSDHRHRIEMGSGGWLRVRSCLGAFTTYRCCRRGRWDRAFLVGASRADTEGADLRSRASERSRRPRRASGDAFCSAQACRKRHDAQAGGRSRRCRCPPGVDLRHSQGVAR